nr:PHP domain-containing protein [Quadrisphaera sp. RL12-1S]
MHTHSTASDGTDDPAGLVSAAADAGVRAMAITDHDTTSGWARAGRQAERCGVLLLPGAEVSCRVRGVTVHLLSYLHDPQEPELAQTLATSRDIRFSRARTMAELLGRDFPITWDDVLAQAAHGATVGRPHVADALVAAGVVADRDEAFAGLLADGSPYVVHHGAPHPVEAVQRVRAAGGVPVIAHALASARGKVVGEDVLEEMVAAGLAGVEVDHRDHTEDAKAWLRDFAKAHDLLTTGSSDYHGTGKQNRLAENTTSPESLQRILAEGRGVDPVGTLKALP